MEFDDVVYEKYIELLNPFLELIEHSEALNYLFERCSFDEEYTSDYLWDAFDDFFNVVYDYDNDEDHIITLNTENIPENIINEYKRYLNNKGNKLVFHVEY